MKLSYRLVSIKDAEIMTIHRNKHRDCFFNNSEVTLEETKSWITDVLSGPNDFTYIINSDNIPVAQFGVYSVVKNESAEMGRVVKYSDEFLPSDMRPICEEILNTISSAFGLKNIFAKVKVWNKKSIFFTASMGFHITNKVIGPEFDYYEMIRESKV